MVTEDLDREAALLLKMEIDSYYGGAVVYDRYPGVEYGRKFAPTSNPVDTRALVQAVKEKGWRFVLTDTGESAAAQCDRDNWTLMHYYRAIPTEDGPNYDLVATTRACVAALKEAQ